MFFFLKLKGVWILTFLLFFLHFREKYTHYDYTYNTESFIYTLRSIVNIFLSKKIKKALDIFDKPWS